jgi:zinc/manganese transport system permease protein
MDLSTLDIDILGPPFAAGLLVLSTHVPLGRQVLQRGIIFIDLAIAQIAGMAVIAAHTLFVEPRAWAVQAIAAAAALGGALLFYVTERRWSKVQEAFIGCAFILAATGGILLLSQNPHGGENLKEMLVGQILWVSYGTLVPVAILYAAILALWFAVGVRSSMMFYLSFALAVTASVQLIGVYLVFASLIIPALAVMHSRRPLAWGYVVGIVGYTLGLVASALFDLPSGAIIVWTLAAAALLFVAALHVLRGVRPDM